MKVFVKFKDGYEFIEEELKVFLKDYLLIIEMLWEIEFWEELFKIMVGKLFKKEFVEEEVVK